MKKSILLILFAFESLMCFSQTSFCPSDPPNNPFLADSPYPIYHRNNYAQASSCISGPTALDSLIIKTKTNITGKTSPWVYLTEKYSNNKRALLYSNATHVYKFIDDGNTISTIDSLRIDFDAFRSFGWNFLLGKNKTWYTYDPKFDPESNQYTKLFKLTDADTTDIYSDIIAVDTLNFGDYSINKVQHFSLNYSGQIVFNSDNNTAQGFATVGVIDQNFNMLDTLQYATTADEIVNHNAFPVDENNAFYIVTTKRLIKFGWDGVDLSLEWQAFYDFVGDGPTGTFAEGSGTTPTLMGWEGNNDKLIVVADGHNNNNLVAFWRELPAGWAGIAGRDIRFADAIQIPYATNFNDNFQSIENSPTVHGYDVAVAQFNGFLGYSCDNFKGVQKFTWNTANNKFDLAWANSTININSVLSYSVGSNLVYGSGKEIDCNYHFYGLDWDTGNVALNKILGPEGTLLNDPFYDGGNNNIIDDEGNVYFPGGASLVKLEKAETLSVPSSELESKISLYPNPASKNINIKIDRSIVLNKVILFDSFGRKLINQTKNLNSIDLTALPDGIYFVKINFGKTHLLKRIVKKSF